MVCGLRWAKCPTGKALMHTIPSPIIAGRHALLVKYSAACDLCLYTEPVTNAWVRIVFALYSIEG